MERNRILAVGMLVTGLVAWGCSKPASDPAGRLSNFLSVNPLAPDTIPGPPPPGGPPPPKVIVPAQLLGADSVGAGEMALTRWRLGNEGRTARAVRWTLDRGPDWPGAFWPSLPQTGQVLIPPLAERDIDVRFAVPADAFSSLYPLRMTVVRADGSDYIADAWMRVFSDAPPPPPPPPVTPAVAFAGWDSSGTQPSVTFWDLHNESEELFTMAWTLTSARNWPGFPITGSEALGAIATQRIQVGFPIPDSAAAGFNHLIMTVTRPSGLPPASAEGGIPVLE